MLTPTVLAALLCAIAGCVDALGYLALDDIFAANMTGNSVLLAIAASHGAWPIVIAQLATLLAFFTGAAGGRLLRRRFARPVAAFLIAALLVAIVPWVIGASHLAAICLLAMAMGLQAASMDHFGGVHLQTVVVTSTIVQFAGELVDRVWPGALADEARTPSPILLHGLAWTAYGVGAVIGAVALDRLGPPFLLPACLLALVGGYEAWQGGSPGRAVARRRSPMR